MLKSSSQKLFYHSFFHSEEKKKIKGALKIAMKDTENQKAETSVRTFGSNVLLATRNKNRLTECFEMKANAIIRTEKKYMDLSSGEKRPHDHTGALENFVWQEKACISEVNNYPDGKLINYSELSRKFDLKFNDGRTPAESHAESNQCGVGCLPCGGRVEG